MGEIPQGTPAGPTVPYPVRRWGRDRFEPAPGRAGPKTFQISPALLAQRYFAPRTATGFSVV
ncbi:hypothetical protein GCM10010464_63200 [Pseudonocardia yunnanensis]